MCSYSTINCVDPKFALFDNKKKYIILHYDKYENVQKKYDRLERILQEFLGLKGIDIRGDGGYVVAPPSLHLSGNLYSWRPGGSPFENAPGECPEFLKAPNLKQTKFQFSGSLTEFS